MNEKLIILDGFHAVKHGLRFGADFTDIITLDSVASEKLAAELAPDIVLLLKRKLRVVSLGELKEISDPPHPTGIAAIARRPRENLNFFSAKRTSPAILLENPRHLGNTGAVIRVAAAAGSAGVIIIGDLDPWHPTVIRGSAGLNYALPVMKVTDTKELTGPLIIFDPEGENLQNFSIPDNAILAFGTERHGVSTGLKQKADKIVSFPMQPGVSSLNLSTSVAVALYHWRLTRPC